MTAPRAWQLTRRSFTATALIAALFPFAAAAQTNPQPPAATLPMVAIATAPLVVPSTAESYYSGASKTATSLKLPPAPEIVELARALKNNPDLIYEYVHNNIEIVWMYGAHKGPLGTLIDKSGTAFDQAELMVALLTQAGYVAAVEAGTISPAGRGFRGLEQYL